MSVDDPRDHSGPFGRLFSEIASCKQARTCPELESRAFYFEPNAATAAAWSEAGYFRDALDRRVVFVCESPGPSVADRTSTDAEICWRQTTRDARFQRIRDEYGLASCMITNTVKCGVRGGSRHLEEEIGACSGFIVRELNLIRPQVAVGVGRNAYRTLRLHIAPRMTDPPVLFEITHYSAHGDVFLAWKREFPELERLLNRLKHSSDRSVDYHR